MAIRGKVRCKARNTIENFTPPNSYRADDATLEPDTGTVGRGDLDCHHGGLSGWIRIVFPKDLCLFHEREHDKYRP